MLKKIKQILQKTKDFLSIAKIRIFNFVQEHKYVSIGIITFFISIIIAIVVFAADNKFNKGDVEKIKIVAAGALEGTVKSFSEFEFSIDYTPKVVATKDENQTVVFIDEVVIEANLGSNKETAVWNVGNENAEYKISDDGQKITAKIINVISDNVQNQILNLKVLNGENGTVLKPTITIKIGSAGDTKVISPELIPSTSIVSTNVDNSELRIKLVNGNSYNKTGFTGRYVPFGILVGFENQKGDVNQNGKLEKNDVQLIDDYIAGKKPLTAEQQKIADLTGDETVTQADVIKLWRYITYPNENDINLEGMYFNLKNLDLIMEMNQKEEGVNTYYPIELSDNETDYGLYKTSMDLFDKMPNSTMYLFDNITNTSVLQKDFVYDSGEVSKLQIASPSGEVIKNSSSSFSLLGGNKQTLTIGNSYKEMGVSFDGINSVSCIAANNCTTTYTLNEKKVDSIASNAEAIYKITYEYVNPETKEISKVIRIVTYVNKKEVTLAGKKYSMAGHENLYLLKNEKYIESGVLRDGVKFNGESGITYTTTIKDFKNVETTVIDTSKSGKYTVTYTLKKQVCVPPTVCATPPCANTCNDEVITLTRNVIITDPIATPVLEANDIYIAYKNPGGFDNNKAPFIINGNESATCETPGNAYSCNSKLEGFSTNKAGTYRTVYTVTSMDTGFSSTVSRNINVVLKYKMIISNIKTDGSFYRSDCFLAIGSYFVTAKSERTNNFMGNYNLKLDVNSVVNESALNYYFDEGKKSSNLALYKKENSSLTEMKESEAISYGETVVLKSTFKYSKSGDKKLNNVTTTINIPNKQFNLLSYYSDEAKSEYYLTVNDKAKTIEDGNIKYFYEGNAQGVSYIDLPKDAIITNVEYTLKDVKPGSDIDFRLKLKTISANSETEVTLNSRSTWECDYQNGYVPIITEVTVNSKKALITAFKARTNLTINESSANAFIDSTKSQKIHLAVYPTVTSPGLFVQTNLVGSLNTVDISVELPDGIHYMYNEEYILPVSTSVKDGKTMLQYRLYNQTFNNWMDIIDIDVRIDINVKNGSKLPIVSTIQATTSNGTTDASIDSEKKLTKQITYTNSEEVVYAQFPSSSSINKKGSFNIITDLYNSTENVKTNLELVTVLPYNGLGDKQLYTGSYEITLPTDITSVVCTSDLSSLVQNTNNLTTPEKINWVSCEQFKAKNGKYVGLTAYKFIFNSLNASETKEIVTNINTIGNTPADKYEFNSFLVVDNKVKTITPTTVSVVSKRITGTIWEDFDSNGLMEKSEKKIEGITLELYNDLDELKDTTTSDNKGKYMFSSLEPGKYYVIAKFPEEKYSLTVPSTGYDVSINSSFTPVIIPEENPTPPIIPPTTSPAVPPKVITTTPSKTTTTTPSKEENPEETIPEKVNKYAARSKEIIIVNETKKIGNINLGLMLKKNYAVKLNLYVTKSISTNKLGVSEIKEHGNVKLAKHNVRDLDAVSIKVVYSLEIENIKYHPGYILSVKEYVPDGMSFNPNYEENKGWVQVSEGIIENRTLANELINGGEKKYLTIAFDVSRKEAGLFTNNALIDDEDLQILIVGSTEEEAGDINE